MYSTSCYTCFCKYPWAKPSNLCVLLVYVDLLQESTAPSTLEECGPDLHGPSLLFALLLTVGDMFYDAHHRNCMQVSGKLLSWAEMKWLRNPLTGRGRSLCNPYHLLEK